MKLQDFIDVLRARWLAVALLTVAGLSAAGAVTLVMTPQYEASTRLFVSALSGASAADTYQGNRLSQERVLSYTELLVGETIAQRTIDRLDLDMTAPELVGHIEASSKTDTVLISLSVRDSSAEQARDIANALSDEFVLMVRELETPQVGSLPNARVVVEQRAVLPAQPVSPNVIVNVLIGLAGGLGVGVAVAVARDRLDNTVSTRESVEKITSRGIIGQIPFDAERRNELSLTFAQNNSPIAEAFRKVRTNLHFLSVDNPPRVVAISSSIPNEGKSTTSINIALALAEADHEVVLVDCDMRRSSLATYLNLEGAVGLSTVLSKRADLNDALQKTAFSGLTVLTSGGLPPNPSELLGSQAARDIFTQLRRQFDYVIIDTSPILAVTDSAVLTAYIDGLLLVARYGHTKVDQLSTAVKQLEDVGAPLLGTVLTMAPQEKKSSYGYLYYEATSTSGDSAKSRSQRSKHRTTPSSR